MGIQTTTTTTATCDLEGCGKAVDVKSATTIVCEMNVRKGPRKTFAFCSKDHCNQWWKKETKENLIL